MLASEMSDEQLDATSQLFAELRSSLTGLIIIAKQNTRDASAVDKRAWAEQTERLVGMKNDVEIAEEAFFDELTLSLDPPSQAQIDETNQLSKKVGEAIADAKTAQAIVTLIDDLAGLANRLRQA